MRYIFYFLAIILTSLLSYYVSSNIILVSCVFAILLTYFIFLEYSLRKKIIPKITKGDDLNIFLHDFLLSYQDNFEIKFSLKKASVNVSSNLKEELRILDEYSGSAILSNLESYFSSSLYSLFLIIVQNKNDNNSNIKFLLDENASRIKKKEEIRSQNKKALYQFTILWLVSYIIFTILRISLNNYFAKLKGSFFYIVGVSLFFLIFFLSLNLFVILFYKRELANEKN